MAKISIVYYSSTGNTEEMANALSEGIRESNGEVYISNIDEVNQEQFFESEILALGSPASGTEEVNEDIESFINENADNFVDKKVFLFGSFGWGDGEYMDGWIDEMKNLGAFVIEPTVTVLEAPDEETIEKLKEIGKDLVNL